MAIGIPWLMRQIAQIPFDMIIFHSGVLWRETLALPLLVRQSITRNLDGSEQEEEWPGFVQLRSCSADQLMYVKEDLILPQGLTFYELIVNKARGKSG